MSMTNTTADAIATAYCAANGITDAAAVAKWKDVYRRLYAALKTDLVATLAAGTVVTVGGATTQTGPAAPVVLTIT